MANQELIVGGFTVEFLNGDDSYIVTVFYLDSKTGQAAGTPDKFSFSTAAKAKKFIAKNLLTSGGEEAAEEVAA